jgi:hypothetical protein
LFRLATPRGGKPGRANPGDRSTGRQGGRPTLARSAAALLAALCVAACGSAITSPPTSLPLLDPSQPRSIDAAVSISAAGVDPQTLHLNSPVTVKFTNNDRVAHKFEPAPELGDGDCPEMNQLGTLEPGQIGSVPFTRLGGFICAYHDTAAPSNLAFKGLLVIH